MNALFRELPCITKLQEGDIIKPTKVLKWGQQKLGRVFLVKKIVDNNIIHFQKLVTMGDCFRLDMYEPVRQAPYNFFIQRGQKLFYIPKTKMKGE